MFKRPFLTIASATALLLLSIAPVYAAPSLSLGSTTSYNLAGKLQATRSCTASPIAYAAQACLGISSVTTTTFVSIFDDGHCSALNPFPLQCRFEPSNVMVPQGSTVEWTNFGNLTHTVTANQTANLGLPSFDSGPLPPHTTFAYTFTLPGAYHYYDSINGTRLLLLRGVVTATSPPPPPPPPMPTTFQVDLSGTVGWNVKGLSSSQANLLVSHNIAVSVSPFPLVTFTPVTESGSFEQSINLSTRAESPGTATSIARSLLATLLSASTASSFATSTSGSIIQTMMDSRASSPDYTQWWVNGPLSNGSPVQILQGWSSVTGSENLNLGTSLGTRPAWIVTSQLSQTFNLNTPNPGNPIGPSSTASAAASLNLLWSFDQTSDLLLRNNNTLTLTMHSVNPTVLYTSTGQVNVTTTRDITVMLSVAMLLSTTNIALAKPHGSSNVMDILASVPWMPFGVAGVAAAIAGGALAFWLSRRAKGASLSGPTPDPSQPAPSTSA